MRCPPLFLFFGGCRDQNLERIGFAIPDWDRLLYLDFCHLLPVDAHLVEKDPPFERVFFFSCHSAVG